MIQPDRRRGEEIHVPFITASLLFGILGGFTLAVSLPLEVIAGSMDASWVAHAQVHGHLQVIGFAGLFVVAMAFRLAPRFGSRRGVSFPGLVPWVLWLLVVGMLARALGQPLAEHAAFAAIMLGGALAEAAGAILFAAILWSTLLDALRARQPHAILLAAASMGLGIQGILGAWWLGELAMEERAILRGDRNQVLLHLQFFGFLLPAILGVGMRSFPTFFGRKPPTPAMGTAVAALALAGVALWTGGGAADAAFEGVPWWLLVGGQALTGLSILVAIALFRPWQRANRLAPASKGLAWAIQPAVLWLGVSGALLVATAAQSALAGRVVSGVTLDAVRHVFAVGVVTLAIVGMAQLILPEFASERLVRTPGAWRGPVFGLVLSLATALRGIVPLAGLTGEPRWWAMAVAGILGWAALAVFAALLWRASRSHRAYVARIERYRTNELPVTE